MSVNSIRSIGANDQIYGSNQQKSEFEKLLDERNIRYTINNGQIRVEGDVDLSGSQITTLPQRLRVDGRLDLSNTQITILPEDLHVGDDLKIDNTQITTLPQGLRVGGS